MKKQNPSFFVLRVLAHQLQRLSASVLRMTEAEEDTILPRISSSGADEGSIERASHVVPTALPVASSILLEEASDDTTPPAHWLDRIRSNVPPPHWLGHVQKSAQAPLVQDAHDQSAERVIDTRRSLAPRSHVQKPAPEPSEHYREETLEAQIQSEMARQDTSGELRGAEAHQSRDVVDQNVPELRLRSELGIPHRTTDEERQGAIMPLQLIEARETDTMGRDRATDQQGPGEDEAHRATDELWRRELPPRQKPRADAVRHVTDVKRIGETTPQEPHENWLSEPHSFVSIKAPHVDEGSLRQASVDRTVLDDLPINRSTVDRVRLDNALSHSGDVQGHARRQNIPGPWSVPGVPVHSQTERTAWPQTSYGSASAYITHMAAQTSQFGTHWPALPEETTNQGPDAEAALRAWERQRRLDEEQRGSAWTA